jgi:elongation factor Ts
MAQISAQLVQELRTKTGAGMGDCKQALVEANGDMQAAIEILRKKGIDTAAKRSDRASNEGIISVKATDDSKTIAMVEVNCETDFVARNQEFVNFSNLLVDVVIQNKPKTIDELLSIKVNNDTVSGLFNEILAKFNEKIQIKRFETLTTNGFFSSYIHAGSKLAVILELNISNPDNDTKVKIRDIAMQIAAMNPLFIDRNNVSEDVINKEKEIYREVLLKEGKNPNFLDRIIEGKLEKFYQEKCLLEQVFVKDSSKTVTDVLNDISKNIGQEVKVLMFKRYTLGD